MAQNFVLKAILDTSDVAAKLKNITNVKGNYSQGIKLLNGQTSSQLKTLGSDLKSFTSKLDMAKNKGIFGDKAKIKDLSKDFDKMFGPQATSNLKRTGAELTKLSKTYGKMRDNALKGRSKAYRDVYKTEGAQGLVARGIAGEKGFAGPKILQSTSQLANLDAAKEKIAAMNAQMQALNANSKATGAAMKGAFNPMVNILNKLGIQGNSLGQIFGTLAGKVTTWLIATSGIFMAIRLVKSYVSEMKNLQDAQIRLQRILPSTGKELDNDTKAAMRFAGAMNVLAGAAYKDTVDALTTAAKAGFGFAGAMDIARAALLTINVTEITNIADATKYLIATIRQFGMEANDSMWILNQWNELAKKTGATANQIAEGVIRSGKSWQSVGGTLSQLNAIVASTIEVTGESGEKIGTMFKTLSARYADIDRAKSLAYQLSKQNINIYDKEQGKFNSIYEVLGKLSSKWGTLNDRQKAGIAKAAAGVRQWSRFLGVVENFDRSIRALAISINSQNSALNENERRVKSLDFALRELQGTWSEMASGKGAVVLLGAMTAILKTLAAALKVVTNPLVMFGIAMSTVGVSLISFSMQFGSIVTGFHYFGLVAGKVFGTLMTKLPILGKAFAGLWAIITLNPFTIALTAIIAFGTAAVLITNKINRANEALRDTISTTINARNEFKKNTDILASQYARSTNKDTRDEIGKTFAGMGNEFSVLLNRLDKVKDSSDEWNKILKEISDKSVNLSSISSQIKLISEEIIKSTKLWTKFLRFLKVDASGYIQDAVATNLQIKMVGLDEKAKAKLVGSLKKTLKDVNYKSINAAMKNNKGKIAHDKNTGYGRVVDWKDSAELTQALDTYDALATTMGWMYTKTESKLMALQSLFAYMSNIKLDGTPDGNGDEGQAEENRNKLLKIVSAYYDKEYKIAQAHYDKLKQLNEDLVDGFTKGIFDLSPEVTGGQRLLNAFSGIGEKIYNQMVGDINSAITDALTGAAPKNPYDKIENAMMVGGKSAAADIAGGFADASGGMVKALKIWSDKLIAILGKDPDEFGAYDEALDTQIKMNGSYAIELKDALHEYNSTLLDGSKELAESIKGMFKDVKGWLGTTFGADKVDAAFMGFGAGSFTAGATGRDQGQGGMYGAGIGALMSMNPATAPFALAASLIGGLFAGPNKDDDEEAEAEKINYAKQSNKELQYINRNTTAMVEELKNFSILQESYYFSFSNSANRGLGA